MVQEMVQGDEGNDRPDQALHVAPPSCFKTRIRKDGTPWAKRKTAKPQRKFSKRTKKDHARRWKKLFGDIPWGRHRFGIPDGMHKADVLPLWEKAHEQGKKFITLMEDLDKVEKVPIPGSEQDMAKEALQKAFVMAVSPLTSSKERAAYIRLVLEFTKAKPESKSKLTLDKSEEWLASLEADMKNNEHQR